MNAMLPQAPFICNGLLFNAEHPPSLGAARIFVMATFAPSQPPAPDPLALLGGVPERLPDTRLTLADGTTLDVPTFAAAPDDQEAAEPLDLAD